MMMQDWTMMGGSGAGHWVFFAIMAVLLLYPIGKILSRLGLSPFWSVLAFIPVVNLIALWLLAWIDWPATERGSAS